MCSVCRAGYVTSARSKHRCVSARYWMQSPDSFICHFIIWGDVAWCLLGKIRLVCIVIIFGKELEKLFWYFYQNSGMKETQVSKLSNDTNHIHMSLFNVCTMFCLFLSHTVSVMSALISALSLSKCHSVSLIFCTFTKKSNLRWKRYVTSKTLRLTVCLFFLNCWCFVEVNSF